MSIRTAFVLSLCFLAVNCANVLFMPMHFASSHKKSMAPAAEAIGKHGHSVVIWAPVVKLDLLKSKHLQDIAFEIDLEDRALLDMYRYENNSATDALLWSMRELSPWGFMFPWKMSAVLCKTAIKKHWSEFEKIIAFKKWDLVVADTFFAPCAYLVAKLTRAPVVAWSTSASAPNTVWARMAPEPFASYPGLSAHETFDLRYFSDRLRNTVKQLLFTMINKVNQFLVLDALAPHEQHFGSFAEFERSAIQAVTQLPQLFDWPRPQLPEIVPTLLTCKSGHPLPQELEEFVSDPKSKGTIVIAFGHMVKWKAAPANVISAFEVALERLKDFRIIWQYDQEDAASSRKLAPHIRKMHWLPQLDLLNHPKTVVFISHAGLKSTMESVCAGVPFVAMPQFAEQYRNTALILARKIGVFIDKFKLTADAIVDAVHEVLDHREYKANMVHLQGLISDQIMSAIDFEAFILERAIRQTYKLRLLQNRGSHLNIVQFFSLDALATCVVSFIASVFIAFVVGRRLFFLIAKQ